MREYSKPHCPKDTWLLVLLTCTKECVANTGVCLPVDYIFCDTHEMVKLSLFGVCNFYIFVALSGGGLRPSLF